MRSPVPAAPPNWATRRFFRFPLSPWAAPGDQSSPVPSKCGRGHPSTATGALDVESYVFAVASIAPLLDHGDDSYPYDVDEPLPDALPADLDPETADILASWLDPALDRAIELLSLLNRRAAEKR